jgi:hypothetical protein
MEQTYACAKQKTFCDYLDPPLWNERIIRDVKTVWKRTLQSVETTET